MKKATALLFTILALLAMAVPSFAAVTVDYAGAVTSVEGQVTTALTAVMPIFGTLLAVGIGIKFFRRFVKG